jgi:hypothetical protein
MEVSALSNLSIIDHAIADDNTIFTLLWDDADASGTTSNGDKTMLFKTKNEGLNWKMILSYSSSNHERMEIICLSPNYAIDKTMYVALNDTRIWKFINGGTTIAGFAASANITAIAAIDGSTYYAGHRNAFYNSGRWTADTLSGGTGTSIVITSDDKIIVGINQGEVLVSSDDGRSFSRIRAQNALGSDNNLTVTIDPAYGSNRTIYAGSDGASTYYQNGIGVFWWVEGSSLSWSSIDSGADWDGADNIAQTADDQALLCSGIAMAENGTLHASSGMSDLGLRRATYPTGNATCESVTADLPAGAELYGVELSTDTNTLYAGTGFLPETTATHTVC